MPTSILSHPHHNENLWDVIEAECFFGFFPLSSLLSACSLIMTNKNWLREWAPFVFTFLRWIKPWTKTRHEQLTWHRKHTTHESTRTKLRIVNFKLLYSQQMSIILLSLSHCYASQFSLFDTLNTSREFIGSPFSCWWCSSTWQWHSNYTSAGHRVWMRKL